MKTASMNFATVIAAFTPSVSSFPSITLRSDVFWNEEEILSEPQPIGDRAKPFMSNDGNTVQYLDKFATNGKRDITLIDGDEVDALMQWAYFNPQPMFNLSFRYQRNDQDATQVREQFHRDCKFMTHPARVISNEIAVVKFNFHYAKLSIFDENGNPVS